MSHENDLSSKRVLQGPDQGEDQEACVCGWVGCGGVRSVDDLRGAAGAVRDTGREQKGGEPTLSLHYWRDVIYHLYQQQQKRQNSSGGRGGNNNNTEWFEGERS